MSPMRLVRITAMTAPPAPMSIASPEITATRLLTGRYSGGAWSERRAGSSDGAIGRPSAAFSGVWLGSGTSGTAVPILEFADHRRRGDIDLGSVQPSLEKIRELSLLLRRHMGQAVDELHLN